jgi:hypothetical protein
VQKHFVVVHVDVQEQGDKQPLMTPGGAELLKNLGGSEQGVPFFAFLDSRGTMVVNTIAAPGNGQKGGNIGYPYEPHEVDWFMTMLSTAVPAISEADHATIEKWLRAQKKKKK